MDQDIAELAPTSTATTRETEPEVVAGISSAEGTPDRRLSIRVGGVEFSYARFALLLAGGMAFGYGAARWLQRRTW